MTKLEELRDTHMRMSYELEDALRDTQDQDFRKIQAFAERYGSKGFKLVSFELIDELRGV